MRVRRHDGHMNHAHHHHMSKHFYVYILENLRHETYVGYTYDVVKRLCKHNGEAKGGARSTRRGRPWKLRATIEYDTKSAAMSAEARIKHASRKLKRVPSNTTPLQHRLRVCESLGFSVKLCF